MSNGLKLYLETMKYMKQRKKELKKDKINYCTYGFLEDIVGKYDICFLSQSGYVAKIWDDLSNGILTRMRAFVLDETVRFLKYNLSTEEDLTNLASHISFGHTALKKSNYDLDDPILSQEYDHKKITDILRDNPWLLMSFMAIEATASEKYKTKSSPKKKGILEKILTFSRY